MNKTSHGKKAGVLFMFAGLAFGIASYLAEQRPFAGAGAALFFIGLSIFVRASKQKDGEAN